MLTLTEENAALKDQIEILKKTLSLTADGEDNQEAMFLAAREENAALKASLENRDTAFRMVFEAHMALKVEVDEWKQQCATSGEVIHRLSGRSNNSLQAQAWICPNCHDDHSRISVCPQYQTLRELLGEAAKYIPFTSQEGRDVQKRIDAVLRK
jgi:Zn finger protein HypA/HybF involved in hydrogenase expression